MQLKTLIPGTALTFTVNSNTITINSNLNINSVGSGTSLINSFANPNVALKSITAGSGITITDNTTSISISSSINSALDSIIGSIEIPTVKIYTLENYINKPYTVNKVYLNNTSGSATIKIKKLDSNSVELLATSTLSVTTTRTTNIITGFSTAIGNQLVLEVLTTSTSLNLSFTIEITYI